MQRTGSATGLSHPSAMFPASDLGSGCGPEESDLLADGAVATSTRDAVMSSREAATTAAGGGL